MFKSEKEFAQAMLDGRKFKGEGSGETYQWSGHFFLRGDVPLGSFIMYHLVTEILPEPEPFKPEKGDEILVSDCKEEEEWDRLKFMGMFSGFFMCEGKTKDKFPMPWKYAKPIPPMPPENPWHDVVPGEWPECKPDDMIEMYSEHGKVGVGEVARMINWSKTATWKRWRYAK